MIPKRIFMIWLGNVVPEYARQTPGLFKKRYPDYDVEFIRYRVGELDKIRSGRVESDVDGAVYEAMREIFDLRETGRYSEYIRNQLKIYGKNIKNIMLLSDIFRLELLNVFGGVYIDIDSVPGKNFDDMLLSGDRFCVCRNYGSRVIPDNYFMGQSEAYTQWINPMDATSAVQVFDPSVRDVMFQYRRAKFIKAQLSPVQTDFYIEHYMIRSWETMDGKAIDDFQDANAV